MSNLRGRRGGERWREHTTLASINAYSKSVFPVSSCWCRKEALVRLRYRAMWRVCDSGRCSRGMDWRSAGAIFEGLRCGCCESFGVVWGVVKWIWWIVSFLLPLWLAGIDFWSLAAYGVGWSS